MHFLASNNAAECEALLHCLTIATALGICQYRVLGDSLLVVSQADKEGSCLDDKMLYCQELPKLENNFDGLEYLHIMQGKNEIADELVKLSSNLAMVPQRSLCRNSMSQASPNQWLKPARRLSHPRKLRRRLRAYPSYLKS
jgi:ribonuclease HI